MATTSQGSTLSLSITNPLVLYRALLATHRIRPDPAQHRLALELQKLYFRLKDYDPEVEYRWRLEKAARLGRKTALKGEWQQGYQQQPERKAVFDDGPFTLSSLFRRNGTTASMMAMTRTIPVHDSAMEIDSPQGLLLYGEVGRGKSMLLDLLYSSLPTTKKRRWHFNTFILDIFRRLELARVERTGMPEALGMEYEHVVLSLARETMETSPILFLDEFQMPDRVSGKLVHGFLTSFFSLGGVLIASSNRMPEELAKASGVEFSRMGSAAKWGRGRQFWEKLSPGQQQARNDFGMFVEVLKKRCEIWEMEGERDWRRDDSFSESDLKTVEEVADMNQAEASNLLETVNENTIAPKSLDDDIDKTSSDSADTPAHYHVSVNAVDQGMPTSSPEFTASLLKLNPTSMWTPITLTVYARKVMLPDTNPDRGIALLPFSLLCTSYLGPADYISIASTFHTLVVSEIPILSLLQKNEARRFITFLDACYEARCRLMIEAAAPPDRLFFPETRARRGGKNMLEAADGDSIESEAFSEMYQDSTAPFRPNISVYADGMSDDRSAQYTPSLTNRDVRSVLADEDADFGPTYGNGRGYGMASDQAALDERDSAARTAELDDGLHPGMRELELHQGPDFTQGAGTFTGQDEQFAYKRARSRLWEMCGRRWWRERRTEDFRTWWAPVHKEGRFWERKREADFLQAEENITDTPEKELINDSAGINSTTTSIDGSHDGSNRRIDDRSKQDGLFRHGASPFRTSSEPPPKFGWQHAWGMMTWGRKAGEWGKGVEGDRSKDTKTSKGSSG